MTERTTEPIKALLQLAKPSHLALPSMACHVNGWNLRSLTLSILAVFHFTVHTSAEESIVFEDAIAPMMRQSCIACHHAKKAEGGLNLESFATLSRGGDSGAIIDPTDAEKSILLDRVTGRVEPIMPPPDNTVDARPLSPDQIGMLKRWIKGGAISKASNSSSAYAFQSLPDHVKASYAMTVTPDGNWLAYARGNDLIFYPINDWSNLLGPATQPLIREDAHRDICFAMAASPDGQRVASGSSGEIKIWRRQVARPLSESTVPNSPPAKPSETAANGQPVKPSETAANGHPAPHSPSSGRGAGGEGQLRLTLDGATIKRIAASKDGSLLATLDEQHRLRLWNSHDVTLSQSQTSDLVQTLAQQRLNRDIDRQKKRIDRWNAKLVELQTVADKEAKAVEAAKQAHEKASKEWESKSQAWQALVAAIADLEKSSPSIQAAFEAAKQQSLDLTEQRKQENADASKLDLAIAGTQALIDLANQRLAEIATQLESKKKSASELQTQEAEAKAALDATQQTVLQAEESQRLAIAAVQKKKSELEPEPKILEQWTSDSDRLKIANADLAVSSIAMTFTADRKHLISINALNELEVYSTLPLQRIAPPIPLLGSFTALQPIGDHDVLLTGAEQASQHWSIETQWELECTLGPELPGIISDRVNSLAFNHDGARLAIGSGIGSRSGHLAILELGLPQRDKLSANAVKIALSEPDFHSDTILGLAFSPDGRTLASCSADKMIKLIDAETLQPIRNFEGHTHHVLGVAWHEDGVNLATTSGDGTVKIWDTETGETTRTFAVGKELTALSFVGNSNRVVSSVIDHTVRMYDIQSKDQIRQFTAAQNALYAITVSPDARLAIAIGQEGIPRAWQIEDGKLVAEIK